MDNQADTRKRRGVFLLPNLFTTGGLFAGFYSIIAAIGQHFEVAAIAIFVAMVMDGLDGRIARLTHTQSDFGVQYDSMADMVAFGVAPALMMYNWTLVRMGKLGWLAAFVYAAGAALRLARFNTQVDISDKRYFQGLASPAAAAVLAGLVWVGQAHDIGAGGFAPLSLVLTVLVALLMVSNIRYHSFKDLDLRGRVPFITGLVIVLAFVLISLDPPQILFIFFLGYAFSGPVFTLVQLQRRRAQRRAAGRGARRSSPRPRED
jgi:CDP-diacylglycerol--serine O-phosphatidyltransferase